jgi:Tol biopolymer transport system component
MVARSTRALLLLALMAAVAVVAGCHKNPVRAAAAKRANREATAKAIETPGKIVYATDKHANWDLYVMPADTSEDKGGEPVRITTDPADDSAPVWSSDADWIYFTRTKHTPGSPATTVQVCGVKADGSEERVVLDKAPERFADLCVSPDGKRLAFSAMRSSGGGDRGIQVLEIESGQATPLTDDGTDDCVPTWSPKGDAIIFVRTPSQSAPPPAPSSSGTGAVSRGMPGQRIATLCSVDVASRKVTTIEVPGGEDSPGIQGNLDRITCKPDMSAIGTSGNDFYIIKLAEKQRPTKIGDPSAMGMVQQAQFDPTGKRLAYCDANMIKILDSGQTVPMAFTRQRCEWPAWSPDGKRIVFASNRAGMGELYTVLPDGSQEKRLTDDAYPDAEPRWSPDGSKIAFTSYRDGKSAIYVMDEDGSNVTQVTTGADADWSPTWSPDAQTIAFARSLKPTSALIPVEGAIILHDLASGAETTLTTSEGPESYPAWSPKGDYMAYSWLDPTNPDSADGSQYIMLMDLPSGQPKQLTLKPGNSVGMTRDTDIRWSPDAKKLLFLRQNNSDPGYHMVDFDAKSTAKLKLDETLTMAHHPCWSPDGKSLMMVREGRELGPDAEVVVVDLASSSSRSLFRITGGTQYLDWWYPSK